MSNECIWLTYSEAAKKLGISIDSVRRKARKEMWAKRKNNSGHITISIPLESGLLTGQEAGHTSGHTIFDLQMRVTALEVELNAERYRANTAEKDRDAWKEQAQMLARPWWKRLAG